MAPAERPAAARTGWVRRLSNYNMVCAIGFVALGIALFFLIPREVARPLMMVGQMSSGLDPERFPQVVATLFVGLGLWYLVHAWRSTERSDLAALGALAGLRVVTTLAVFLAYALLMEPLGFVVSSALAALGLSFFLGNRNVLLGVLVCAGIPVAIYYLFTRILHVYLPEPSLFAVPM